jgi:DNA-binding GntR family transcriptional regulator
MRTGELKMQPKKKRGRPRKVLGIGQPATDRTRLQRSSLHERATERLRTMIVRGELAPDSALVESELCDLLGVSRTPLREALKLLAVQGLVELRQNRSARIPPIREEDIRDLFEAVSGIERAAAELAARRITPTQLDELRLLQDEIERHFADGNLQVYFSVNQQIHRAIVVASGNATLLETHAWLLGRAERARYLALSSPRRWGESVNEHRAILGALSARDAEAAGRLLGAHVLRTGGEVIEVLRPSAAA